MARTNEMREEEVVSLPAPNRLPAKPLSSSSLSLCFGASSKRCWAKQVFVEVYTK